MSASFPKSERLTGRSDISRLFKEGKQTFTHPFKVFYFASGLNDSCRFLVSVPQKNFKKAVDRNKIKRRTKEAYRLNKHILSGKNYDMAFIYIAKEILSYETIEEKLLEILHRLK